MLGGGGLLAPKVLVADQLLLARVLNDILVLGLSLGSMARAAYPRALRPLRFSQLGIWQLCPPTPACRFASGCRPWSVSVQLAASSGHWLHSSRDVQHALILLKSMRRRVESPPQSQKSPKSGRVSAGHRCLACDTSGRPEEDLPRGDPCPMTKAEKAHGLRSILQSRRPADTIYMPAFHKIPGGRARTTEGHAAAPLQSSAIRIDSCFGRICHLTR